MRIRNQISSILSRLRRGRPSRQPEPAEPDFSLRFTAMEDFDEGDKLICCGDSLYKWREGCTGQPTFVARRPIKAMAEVSNDPTDPKSDLSTAWRIV
jgi:hypothetical protein